jgi:hypothetical protein
MDAKGVQITKYTHTLGGLKGNRLQMAVTGIGMLRWDELGGSY